MNFRKEVDSLIDLTKRFFSKLVNLVKVYPVAPVLIATNLVLLAFNANANELLDSDLYISILKTTLVVLVSYFIFLFVYSFDQVKTNLNTFVFISIIYYQGWFFEIAQNNRLLDVLTLNNKLHLIVLLACWLVFLVIVKKVSWNLEPVLTSILIASIVFVYPQVFSASKIIAQNSEYYRFKWHGQSNLAQPHQNNTETSPDVYYLTFDRYPNKYVLLEEYGFDNTEFLKQLEDRGFRIFNDSISSYPSTAVSFSSTLNMDYHANSSEWPFNEKSKSVQAPLFSKIQNNIVEANFNELGYKNIQVSTWYTPLYKRHTNIDEHTRYSHTLSILGLDINLSELDSLYLPKSIVRTFMINPPRLGNKKIVDSDIGFFHRNTNEFQLKNLAKSTEIEGKKFIHSHFTLPHPPYVYNRDGSFTNSSEVSERSEKENFINQLVFTNSEIIRLVDEIDKEYTEEQKPVLILQAEEGPYFKELTEQATAFDWKEITDYQIFVKTGILNAVRFNDNSTLTRQRAAPINIFRTVFNEYFNQGFNILPVKSFTYDKNVYSFEDKSEQINDVYKKIKVKEQ